MSTNPSIIFYQGRRCTKVPRQPRATDPPSTTNNAPTTTSSTDRDTPDETEAPQPSIRTTSTTVAPKPTLTSDSDSESSSAESQDQSSSNPSETPSLGSDNSIYSTAPTDPAGTHTTFTTETSTSTTSTSPTEPVASVSEDDGSGPPYGTIFGTLFGIVGGIALILIIFFLFRRRSRRRSTGYDEPEAWSEKKPLYSGRGSPDSTTMLCRDVRSGMSYLSDASPAASTLSRPETTPSPYFDKPVQYTQSRSGPDQNPFSDAAEIPPGLQSSIVPFMMRSSAMDMDPDLNSRTKVNPDPTYPAESYAPYRDRDRDSVQSGVSLGSTLVLPGRSSAGSNYQGMVFPTPPDHQSSLMQRVMVRGNLDLYEADGERNRPLIPASRRSSGTIPIALI
ncbi:hypothetical protein BJX63DRAFT_415112 [Aspergillus granulosus]|uniref:Uncharacterized protein n=1 Tax=Aspergillus granulosus TaxID=176169 RepID=A0ABR4GTN6_9EURO